MDMLDSVRRPPAQVMTVNGFHIVVLLSAGFCMFSLLVIRGVQEQSSKSVGFLLQSIARNAAHYLAAKPLI